MFVYQVPIRVRYSETDQMGVVYYGNYASYLEVARVESIRSLGISYKQMEEEGFLMPVLEYKTKYIRPAKYDDLLTIEVCIKEMPKARIVFTYEIKNEVGTLLNIAETTLVFLDQKTMRPCAIPEIFEKNLAPFFNQLPT